MKIASLTPCAMLHWMMIVTTWLGSPGAGRPTTIGDKIVDGYQLTPPLKRAESCESFKLMFVTHYIDIQSGGLQGRYKRSITWYTERFMHFVHNLGFPVMLYIDVEIALEFGVKENELLTIVPWSSVNISLYKEFRGLEHETLISDRFKRGIPISVGGWKTFTLEGYNLVNHEKYAALLDASTRSPQEYTHFSWWDFGGLRYPQMVPQNPDLCRLPADRILLSNSNIWDQPYDPIAPTEIFKLVDAVYAASKIYHAARSVAGPEIPKGQWYNLTGSIGGLFPKDGICGTIQIHPRSLVTSFVYSYQAALRELYAAGVATYDQWVMMYMYKKARGNLPWTLYSPPASVKYDRCRSLYSHYLNNPPCGPDMDNKCARVGQG